VNDVMVLFITGHYGNYHYGNWLAAAAGDDVHDDDGACNLAPPAVSYKMSHRIKMPPGTQFVSTD